MKTVVVMVCPSAFADTVIPANFSPAADLMVPVRMELPAAALTGLGAKNLGAKRDRQ